MREQKGCSKVLLREDFSLLLHCKKRNYCYWSIQMYKLLDKMSITDVVHKMTWKHGFDKLTLLWVWRPCNLAVGWGWLVGRCITCLRKWLAVEEVHSLAVEEVRNLAEGEVHSLAEGVEEDVKSLVVMIQWHVLHFSVAVPFSLASFCKWTDGKCKLLWRTWQGCTPQWQLWNQRCFYCCFYRWLLLE